MTVTVAEKPQLLELLREANFTSVFVGIESPRLDSLVETKKRQNVHRPLIESIRTIQSHNLMVVAGMIVGFDHDDVRIFQEQFDFLMEAGIAFTTCGVLTAIEKTPLRARRRFFVRTLRDALRGRPSLEKLVGSIAYLIAHKHFHEYVTGTHGDPEAVTNVSPFAEAPSVRERARDEFSRDFVRRLRREF